MAAAISATRAGSSTPKSLLVLVAEVAGLGVDVAEERFHELLERPRGLVGERAPGVQHGPAGPGLGEHGEDEKPREAVDAAGGAEQAGRDERVVVAPGAERAVGGKHGGIVVDDAVHLLAQQLDVGLIETVLDQALLLQSLEDALRRIVSEQPPARAGDRDAVQQLVGVDLAGERGEEAGREVRRLHPQRFVAEGLEMRVVLVHAGPSW